MQRIVTHSTVKEDGVIVIECATADQNTLLENKGIYFYFILSSEINVYQK